MQKTRTLDPKERFTKVPNEIIRHKDLDPYDKTVFLSIGSLNPSWPSYDYIKKETGLSRERIWKSLKKLIAMRLIFVIRGGPRRSNQYGTPWTTYDDDGITGSPDELPKVTPVRQTNRCDSPDELQSVRQTNSNKSPGIRRSLSEEAEGSFQEPMGTEPGTPRRGKAELDALLNSCLRDVPR